MLMAINPLASAQPATATDPAPAPALTVRGGIPNFTGKLKAGKNVTIVFLGGPITAGGGERGFASLLVGWLRARDPAAQLRLINAGLIDGGSALGAARYQRDVAPHTPDLLLVEFVVDDAGKDDRLRHLERIVHKTWTADPTIDIVFLYALSEAHRDDYRAGRLPPAAALHERVAEHYRIPSIAMGIDLAARLDAGKARWAEQFYDDSRPTPAGYRAYGDALVAGVQTLLADETARTTVQHELKAPLSPDFVLRPTSRPAATMPVPPPMTDAARRRAQETYAMPVIGKHWTGSPDYTDADGRVVWRLLTQSARDNGRRLNDGFGLDRSRWGVPMRWFEEWDYFTGPAGVYLAHSHDGKTNRLAARENDLPIVTFTAPRAGRYLVRAKSDSVALWGLHNALAMNVVRFPAGQTKGTSIAFHRTRAGVAETPKIEIDLALNEGDDLAFQLDTNATGGGGGAAYLEVDLAIGWFDEKPE